MTTHWTQRIHHDGSLAYVSNPYPTLNETVTITLRLPIDAPVQHVFLRSEPDGESHMTAMSITDTDATCAYWACEFVAAMPVNGYRFKIMTPEGAYYYNAVGVSRANMPDAYDFKLLADFQGADWVHSAVFYQIFPDRFRNGDPSLTPKPGAWKKREYSVTVNEWGTPPPKYQEKGNLDFYGGDLPGIIEKLDYLQELGVTALYLNPIFLSNSNHRYNIDDFFNVDPHLGGNEALIKLREALDERGMRLILDVTPNHTSSMHPWFLEAQENASAPSADFFTFYDRPHDYVSWLGVRSLPKLNYNSDKLREIMYEGEDSVLRHWLKPPFRIDGWRLDVANMTARQGETQLAHKVGRGMRRAVKSVRSDSYLMGENFFDGSPYLQGNELDAIMNYQGFCIPVWRWLAGYDGYNHGDGSWDSAPIPAEVLDEQLRLYRGAIPWVVALQQFNLLDSHDTDRVRTILGSDDALQKIAVTMLMTYPGTASVYYGDEIGLEGKNDPDNRRTMPWDESDWHQDLLSFYKNMIELRCTQPALIDGGFQTIMAEGDVFCYVREHPEQRLVVLVYRGEENRKQFTIPIHIGGIADGASLSDLLSDHNATVADGSLILSDLPAKSCFVWQVS